MDAVKYLENDHLNALKILEALEKKTAAAQKNRQAKFETLKQELYLHEQVEQQIIYPALKNKKKDIILEAYQEHHLVNLLLEDISNTSTDDESWVAKITVLKECLIHHIKEERSKIFPLLKKLFPIDKRRELTAEMDEIKASLKNSLA